MFNCLPLVLKINYQYCYVIIFNIILYKKTLSFVMVKSKLDQIKIYVVEV
jgi:hypothetical protein